jgi:hypothetical protein
LEAVSLPDRAFKAFRVSTGLCSPKRRSKILGKTNIRKRIEKNRKKLVLKY